MKHFTMLTRKHVLIICLVLCAGSQVRAADKMVMASAVEQGLLFEVRRPVSAGMREGANGSHGLADEVLSWDLVLRNVGEKKLAVVTPKERLLPRAREPYGRINGSLAGCVYTLPRIANGDNGSEIVKPKPSELDIVELEPGQAVLLGRLKFVYDPSSDGGKIRFTYSVEDRLGDFYPVWCGALSVDVSAEQILSGLK